MKEIPAVNSPHMLDLQLQVTRKSEENDVIDQAYLFQRTYQLSETKHLVLPTLFVRHTNGEVVTLAPINDKQTNVHYFFNYLEAFLETSSAEQFYRWVKEKAAEMRTPQEHYDMFEAHSER